MLHVLVSEHEPLRALFRQRLRKAVVMAGVMLLPPIAGRLLFHGMVDKGTLVVTAVNALAILVAFWLRTTIRAYPGLANGRALVVSTMGAHLLISTVLLAARLPYDRTALVWGFLAHLATLLVYRFFADRRERPLVGIVPFGEARRVADLTQVQVVTLSTPNLHEGRACAAIVADFGAALPREWESLLADHALEGRMVLHYKQLAESVTGRVEVDHLSENSFGSLVPARAWFQVKTMIDWLAALLLLPLLVVLTIVIGLAIRLDDGGDVFFVQDRIGVGGRTFRMLKFRTMRTRGEVECRQSDAQTRVNDERVTRVGAVLRKYRLDELPQLINVLRGEMSFIGPRPEALALAEWYRREIPFYRYRHVVRPGITGWAQVRQGHVTELDDAVLKLQYDFYYIKQFSPWIDLVVAFQTLTTILLGRGAR